MVCLSKKAFVHRDLAARNVLVCNGDTCKVAYCYTHPSHLTIMSMFPFHNWFLSFLPNSTPYLHSSNPLPPTSFITGFMPTLSLTLLLHNSSPQIADFGMSRDLQDEDYYRSHGGKIPVKWTAPEVWAPPSSQC